MVGGRGWAGDERLEGVRALAGEVDLRVAVAGHVVARDAHAPQAQQGPAVGGRVGPRRHARLEPPELLATDVVVVVLAVVADPQVAPSRSVPVAEEHRERTVAGRERDRRAVPRAGACSGGRPRCPGRGTSRRACVSTYGRTPASADVAEPSQVGAERRRGRGVGDRPHVSFAGSNRQSPRPRSSCDPPIRSTARSTIPSLSMSIG